MTVVSIIIPVAPYHDDIVLRAMDSAKRQTVACEVIEVNDTDGKGAGWARNEGVKRAAGDFVVFLDADDYLFPEFVAECLQAYEPLTYVYTGWMEGGRMMLPPAKAPFMGDKHLVTTLYPRKIFQFLGGFDTTLPGHEDVDFYLRSISRGVCGRLVNKPLMHYSEHGQRSISFRQLETAQAIRDTIAKRNGGEITIMGGCCGTPGTPITGDPGAKQEGDILAEILWNGNKSEAAHSNNARLYIGSRGHKLWVNAKDVQTMRQPNGQPLFKEVVDMSKLAPDRDKVLREAGLG